MCLCVYIYIYTAIKPQQKYIGNSRFFIFKTYKCIHLKYIFILKLRSLKWTHMYIIYIINIIKVHIYIYLQRSHRFKKKNYL